jgi:hypothetical protein
MGMAGDDGQPWRPDAHGCTLTHPSDHASQDHRQSMAAWMGGQWWALGCITDLQNTKTHKQMRFRDIPAAFDDAGIYSEISVESMQQVVLQKSSRLILYIS